jgi:uncharacterized protein YrzB (UPF0473 family)
MANNNEKNANDLTVTLLLDDDKELECAVLKIYEANGKNYIAVQPLEMVDDPEGDVYIYRFHEDENGPVLENIEDDEEFDAAIDAFDEFLDELDFFELVNDEEETQA